MGAAAGIAQAGLTMVGAYSQSQSELAEGAYRKSVAEQNERLALMQADDAIRRGDRAAIEHKKQVNQVIGSQRANLAAQGIEIDSGSAAAIQEETAAIGAQDVMQIKNNAWREAWGFKVQAQNAGSEGRWASLNAGNRARTTLLTGGLQAASFGAQAYGKGK